MIKITGYLKLFLGLLLLQHSYAQDVSINIKNAASIQLGVSTSILVTVCNEDPRPIDAPADKLHPQISVSADCEITEITNTDGSPLTGWSIQNNPVANARSIELSNTLPLRNGESASFNVVIEGTGLSDLAALHATLDFGGDPTLENNPANDHSSSRIAVIQTPSVAREVSVDAVQTSDAEASGSHLYFYPNPVKERLVINSSGPSEIQLLNTKGELMYQTTYDDDRSVDMRGFPSGIYVVKITGGNGLIHSGKVLKE